MLSEIDQLKGNDSIGNPIQFDYPFVGKISPTTLKYIKIAGDLELYFGSLNGYKIIEIGGGCGGQAVILSRLYDLSEYALIDLPEVLYLQDIYLEQFDISHRIIQMNDLDQVDEYDLIISNYAFSECAHQVQEKYLAEVIAKSSKGYMICNQISQNHGITSLSKQELVERLSSLGFKVRVLEEAAETYSGNYLLIFNK